MLSSILNTFANCFKIPELKSRIGFTFMVLAICRLAAFIRIPGLDGAALSQFFAETAKTSGGGLLNMYSLFTGGAMENWGLVIYRESSLLYNPSSDTALNKRRVSVVVAHELAHQWVCVVFEISNKLILVIQLTSIA